MKCGNNILSHSSSQFPTWCPATYRILCSISLFVLQVGGSFGNFLQCQEPAACWTVNALPGETPDENEQRFQDNPPQILYSAVVLYFLPSASPFPAQLEFSAPQCSVRAFQSNPRPTSQRGAAGWLTPPCSEVGTVPTPRGCLPALPSLLLLTHASYNKPLLLGAGALCSKPKPLLYLHPFHI